MPSYDARAAQLIIATDDLIEKLEAKAGAAEREARAAWHGQRSAFCEGQAHAWRHAVAQLRTIVRP